MGKYDPLRELLARQTGSSIRLSFAEVEAVLAAPLPISARIHAAWWANETVGAHVQARAWQSAGWRVDGVDMRRGVVAFSRI